MPNEIIKQEQIYSKDINRSINPAVSATDVSEDIINIEIDEYVFTSEILDGIFEILYAIKNRKLHHIGIWISGYFGSGKSHFLKYVSYCLNPLYTDKATHRLMDALRENDPLTSTEYRSNISISDMDDIVRWLKNGAQVDIIMFNIGTIHNNRIDQSVAFLDAFWNQFNKHRGYNSFNISLAQHFEKVLDEKGQFENFKQRIADEGGNWDDDAAELAINEIDFILDTAKELVPTMSIDIIRERIRKDDTVISVETFGNELKSHIKSKGEDYRVIFLVDEVSQFIGSNKNLFLQLQEIVTRLSEQCNNQAWVACTAQQDLSELLHNFQMSHTAEDYGHILGRFEVKVSLKGTQPEYITQKRILDKNSAAERLLKDLYKTNKNALETQFDNLPNGYLKFTDAQNYSDFYPFVPYQFKLIMQVFNNFVELSYVDREVKGNERSIIKVTHNTAKSVENESIGMLVSFDQFYNHMFQNSLTAMGQRSIKHAEDIAKTYIEDKELALRLVNILFMICNISESDKMTFPATLDNITCLMMRDITANKLSFKNKLENILSFLCENNVIHQEKTNQGIEFYKFFTEEERDMANRIKNSQVTSDSQAQKLYNIISQYLSPSNKLNYCGNSFNIQFNVDDYTYLTKSNEDVKIKFDIASIEDVQRMALSGSLKEMVYCMAEQYNTSSKLKRDFYWYCQVDDFVRSTPPANDKQSQALLKFGANAKEVLDRDIKPAIHRILDTCPIIIGTNVLSTTELGAIKGSERYKKALELHFSNIYKYASYAVATGVPRSSDELKRRILSPLENYTAIPMSEGESQINNYLIRQSNNVILSDLVSYFYKPPFGWNNVATIFFVNELVRRNNRSWSYNNTDNVAANIVANNVLNESNKFVIKPAQQIAQDLIINFVEAWKDIFNSRSLVIDMGASAIFDKCKKEIITLIDNNNTLFSTVARYPFGHYIKEVIDLLNEWNAERDASKFFQKVVDCRDKAKSMMDKRKDIQSFVDDQLKKYESIIRFVNDNQTNLPYLNDNNIKDSIEHIKTDENPDVVLYNKLMKEVDTKLRGIKSELIQEIKDVYQSVFDDLESLVRKSNVPDTIIPQRDSIDKQVERATNISALEAIKLNADQFRASQIQNILSFCNERDKANDPQTRTTISFQLKTSSSHTLKTEKDIDDYLDSLKQQLMERLEKNDLMIL